ncbi:NADP-dependent oxidoreductase domain-containing protein [Pelagophyceae sp. CCMP2097]|nr:NADP-dependent oxidoreductase domain-containing protein [Pelagophyceae sp. CCMP2097]|mmetsp:Transcript_13492/g.46976  ORF Transcript_13492/g.46976 Transcript_13492/m.46976 type:complete len:318 (-) Transcript_13492:37-990(-)
MRLALLMALVSRTAGLAVPAATRRQLLVEGAAAAAVAANVPAALAAPQATSAVLRDGSTFPLVSFGFQVYGDEEAKQYATMALDTGYRNFFASVLAGNERGFTKALKASKIDRSQVYVCGSVVSNRARGYAGAYEATMRGGLASLDKLGPMDMLMLDYPAGDAESIRGQWRAFEDLQKQGAAKTLAVSNFSPTQLDAVMVTTADWKPFSLPAVNQLPLGVGYDAANNRNLLAENAKRGILVQAWSPLRVLSKQAKAACASVGSKHGKTAQQIALKWVVQRGAAFTTQTKSEQHCRETIDIFDFELSPEELATLDTVA